MYTFLLPLRRAGLTFPVIWDKSTGHVTLLCEWWGRRVWHVLSVGLVGGSGLFLSGRLDNCVIQSVGPIGGSGLFLSGKLDDCATRGTGALLGSWERVCWDPQEARPTSLPVMTLGSGLESFIAFNQSCLTRQGEGGEVPWKGL